MKAKKTFTEPCGCKYNMRGWQVLCAKHDKEIKEVHSRWLEDHNNLMKEKHHE